VTRKADEEARCNVPDGAGPGLRAPARRARAWARARVGWLGRLRQPTAGSAQAAGAWPGERRVRTPPRLPPKMLVHCIRYRRRAAPLGPITVNRGGRPAIQSCQCAHFCGPSKCIRACAEGSPARADTAVPPGGRRAPLPGRPPRPTGRVLAGAPTAAAPGGRRVVGRSGGLPSSCESQARCVAGPAGGRPAAGLAPSPLCPSLRTKDT
jgi:hypothetical protein